MIHYNIYIYMYIYILFFYFFFLYELLNKLSVLLYTISYFKTPKVSILQELKIILMKIDPLSKQSWTPTFIL